MNLTALKQIFGPPTVNVSGSSIIDVAGDSHTHYTHNGDVYNKISTHAGNQLKTHDWMVFPALTVNYRLSLANNLRLRLNGCRLQFTGARSSSSMSRRNTEESIEDDRYMGQGWEWG